MVHLPPNGQYTLNDLSEAWLQGRLARGEITKRTVDVERSRIESLLRSSAGGEIDHRAVLVWQASIGRYAASTRRSYLSTVRNFYRWAIAEGYVSENPTEGTVPVREPRRIPRALSRADVARVLVSCPDSRYRAVVWLMVGCGLRCVEVSNLDVADYDRSSQSILVRGKGGHERVLPVPSPVRSALDCYMDDRGGRGGPLITPDSRGRINRAGRVSPQRISAMIAELMTRAGVHISPRDGRTAHALRHTAASDVLDNCHDVRIVQAMLGHASVATTSIYLRRASLGQMREAMGDRDYDHPPGDREEGKNAQGHTGAA